MDSKYEVGYRFNYKNFVFKRLRKEHVLVELPEDNEFSILCFKNCNDELGHTRPEANEEIGVKRRKGERVQIGGVSEEVTKIEWSNTGVVRKWFDK